MSKEKTKIYLIKYKYKIAFVSCWEQSWSYLDDSENLQSLKEDFQQVKEDLQSLKENLQPLKENLQNLEENLQNLKENRQNLEENLQSLKAYTLEEEKTISWKNLKCQT